MWLKHTLTRTHTDAALRLDRYPSLFCWRRHWHHSWPQAKHTFILHREREGERGETEGGIETGTGGGRERKKDWHHLLPGHKVACSFGMCVRLCYTYAAPPSEGEWVRDKIGSETTLSGKQDHRLVFPLQPLTSTPWTFSFMWSSRVVLPSFLFFQQYPSFLYFTFLRL